MIQKLSFVKESAYIVHSLNEIGDLNKKNYSTSETLANWKEILASSSSVCKKSFQW